MSVRFNPFTGKLDLIEKSPWIKSGDDIYYSDGNVGIGTDAPETKLQVIGAMDVVSGYNSIKLGGDLGLTIRTDNTTKYGRIGGAHYTNSEQPVAFFLYSSTVTNNYLYIGGGSTSLNTCTGLMFYTAANNTTTSGTERMRLNSSGNLGIGTTSPSGKIHVSEGAFANVPLFERTEMSTDTTGSSFRLLATKTSNMGDGFGPLFTLNIQDDAGIINPIGAIGAVRYGADNSGAIVFNSYKLGAISESMRIDSYGNIGIGTTVPSTVLDMQRDGFVFIRCASTTDRAGFQIESNSTDYALVYMPKDSNDIVWQTGGFDRLWMKGTTGNIGIGIDEPDAKLDVDGDIRYDGRDVLRYQLLLS